MDFMNLLNIKSEIGRIEKSITAQTGKRAGKFKRLIGLINFFLMTYLGWI
jgi:hypothetical protein